MVFLTLPSRTHIGTRSLLVRILSKIRQKLPLPQKTQGIYFKFHYLDHGVVDLTYLNRYFESLNQEINNKSEG